MLYKQIRYKLLVCVVHKVVLLLSSIILLNRLSTMKKGLPIKIKFPNLHPKLQSIMHCMSNNDSVAVLQKQVIMHKKLGFRLFTLYRFGVHFMF